MNLRNMLFKKYLSKLRKKITEDEELTNINLDDLKSENYDKELIKKKT
jgi:hypothetical protein